MKTFITKNRLILLSIGLLLFQRIAVAQNSALASWTVNYERPKAFIENKGQFQNNDSKNDAPVLFAVDQGATSIYFTTKGVSYSFLKTWKKEDKKDELEEEKRLGKIKTAAQYRKLENEEHRLEWKKDVVDMFWGNANPAVEIVAEQETPDYHSYTYKEKGGKETSVENVRGFKKITYKNIYPNIDVEYTFHPQSGIKYAFILHPGADASLIQMSYSKKLTLDEEQNLHIASKFGDIIDHAPLTFYQGNQNNTVASHFVKSGHTVSFALANYDATKTLVIDPWTQTPAFATNWDCVWECERDGTGNVYIIGGVMPLQLLKYNTTGVLQWTYNTPYDTTSWLGTFATDLAGNSYVTRGSAAAIVKVSTTGTVIWNNPSPGGLFSSTEFWNIAFNCDQTKLIIGGTGGIIPPLPYIYNVDMASGNVTSSVQVTGGALIPTQEVRSITPATNGRYYWLTHDSLGYINQNFSLCPTSSTLFKINNGYGLSYKCEDWRYDNSGIMAIRANGNFVYTCRGNQVHKRSLATGAILTTATIPSGGFSTGFGGNQIQNAGIDIDVCGNVYVGAKNSVTKFDANLNVLSSVATSFNVYDLHVNNAGEIVVCGSTGTSGTAVRTGTVQVINMGACTVMTQVCCDATICPISNMCLTDPAITLTSATAAGTWSGTGITNTTTGVFNPATAGVGTHTIYYDLGCGRDSIFITVSPCAALNVCVETNGSLSVSNGVAPYTWQQYFPATSTPITNSAQCTSCGYTWFFGTCLNGVAPVTSCNTPAYWFTFSTATNSGTLPGTYPIQVTDAAGTVFTIANAAAYAALLPCSSSCPPLTITPAAQVNVNCFGQSTGSFSASTTGGASPYDYTLLNGATTVATFTNIAGSQSFTGLAAGTYTLNTLDNSGCPGSVTVTITQPTSAAAVAITGTTNASCGSSTGSATAQASGGSSPYDYVWTGASGTLQTTNNITTANTLSGLAAGTYTVTITDNNGCTNSTTATITNSSGGTVAITAQTNVLCFGGTTGDATANASGGTGPYDYVWTGASGTLQTTNNISVPNTLSGLAAGTYTVSVTDNSGCTSTNTVTITQPTSATTVAITGSTNTVCGSTTGSATALASGGSSPFDYVWTGASGTLQTTNNSTTSDVLSGLAGGSYTVTVTDNNGCTATTNVSITSAGGATVSITSQTNVLCFGGTTGDATATSVGGTSPYDYIWVNASGTLQTATNITVPNTLSGLAAGTYTVTVTDNNGCVSDTTVTITQPATAASVATTGTTPAGCGLSNGDATALASGGTGPYDYVWTGLSGTLQTTNNSSVADNLTGLSAGTYTVTITDNNGCTASTTATVTNSGGATTSITAQTNVLCFGGTTGSATAATAGGSSPYDYVWTGASGTLQTATNITVPNTLIGLGAGTYTVTVTDNGGCISSCTVTITQPSAALTSSTASSANTTCGFNNGSGTVLSTGGTGGYTYNWTPSGGTSPTASSLASGTYTVTTTDANGCSATTTVVVGASTGITASISSQTNVFCNGGSTGTATAAGGGGTTYTYLWTPGGSTSATATALAAGTYTVTITSGSCSNTAIATIIQPAPITASISTTAATCANPTGTATVTAAGGNGVLTPLWSNSSTNSTITNLTAGTYSVTVTDVNGCSQSATGTVATTGGIIANAGTDVTILSGTSTTLSASGGTTYTWTPATGLSCTNCANPIATPTQTTTYCVVADSATCTDNDCVTINVEVPCPDNKDLSAPNAFSPNGDGHNDLFCLQGWSNCIQSFTIYIYDRWGEKVFESSEANFCWDGTYKGRMMDPGVFVYFINATFSNGTDVDSKGNISLIR